MTRGGVSAKMKNKNTWSIPDIAALADYFGVPVTSLLDDTLMRQMLGEGNLGASLVAATTARFPVRAAEGQADGLKPLETKGSEHDTSWNPEPVGTPRESRTLVVRLKSGVLTVRRWGLTTRYTLRELRR